MTTANQKIVSSEEELLILVDQDDNHTGNLSKADCHNGDGVLHRAFSVFLFNRQGELLLQQRSDTKRLWPMYWSNSCCSHPRRGESMEVATRRRLEEELGVAVVLRYVYQFQYQASFGSVGSENELCSVYLGRSQDEVRPNETEIDEIRFLAPAVLEQELAATPEEFTPWFRQEWDCLRAEHTAVLESYLCSD